MSALAYFVTHHPLLAFAAWLPLACGVLGWFEQRRNLRSDHL